MNLCIQGVRFGYDSTEILGDVTFEVAEGEVLGIIGPNGAGKTTLLRCINRTLIPWTGVVLIDGQDVARWSRREIAQRMGLVPQDPTITFPFTVLEVVLMGRHPHRSPLSGESRQDLEVVREALQLTDTLQFADRPITGLSGGERRRVVIARALAQEPEVLLLDEPTLHLDIGHQLEVLALVKRLAADERLTVVLTSHDLNLAARYCDRLLMLEQGRVYAVGTPEEVLTPANIRRVYRVEVAVVRHPALETLQILPLAPVRAD